MMRDSFRSPKLSRPNLFSVLPRERIFCHLDQQWLHPVVWVSGPPGAGKTILVASYLETRNLPGIWYQVDDADVDPATFFYFLGVAGAQAAPQNRIQLPVLTPECMADIGGFSRRFFRELYSRLPRPYTLVFDNFRVSATSILSSVIIPIACEEIPEGVNVILVCRNDPPAELSRLVASRMVAQFDYRELRLTLEETRELAKFESETDEEVVQSLQTVSDGWAAGVVLMLVHRRRDAVSAPAGMLSSREAIFNYFASELFNRADPEMRDLLFRTAALPRVTVSMAQILTCNAEVGELLEFLYRNNLFTNRRDDGEVTYQYHALFREFLLAGASKFFSIKEAHDIKRRAAELLGAGGQIEEAVELYLAISDWDKAVQMILAQARDLLGNGRHQVLRNWILALPQPEVERSPWILYWLGTCDLAVRPVQARKIFRDAFVLMRAQHDTIGKILVVSGIVESYYLEWNDLNPIDEWIVELECLFEQEPYFPSFDVEICALRGMLIAAVSRQPQHRMLAACAQRLMTVLNEDSDINRIVTTGTILLHYFLLNYDIENSTRVTAQIRPLLMHPNLISVNRALWLLRYARYCAFLGDQETVTESYRNALTIIQNEDLHFLEPVACAQQLIFGMRLFDSAEAQIIIDRLERNAYPVRRIDAASLLYGRAWIAVQQSQLGTALQHAQMALDVATESGAVTVRALCLRLMAGVLSEQGEIESARLCLQQARSGAPAGAARYLDYREQLLDASCALEQEDTPVAKELLKSALAVAKQERYGNLIWWPRMAARLFRFALQQGIEVAYVQQTIKKCGLVCELGGIENWPSPIKIYALGRFEVVIEDVRLQSTGKAQRKPLDLLKCLIALGGRQVSPSSIIRFLWPDSNGDAAQTTFDSAVLRLRRLLGRPDALLLSDGRLTLNPKIVWVDVWAFERLLSKLEATNLPLNDSTVVEEISGNAFRLYQGHFLGQEEEMPWMLAMRERLRSKLLRQLVAVGRYWEASEQWDKASGLYQRGLELDHLAEELYQRLMCVYQQRGQSASALEVYRRCRKMLSVVLGVKPSAQIESIYQSLTEC